MCFEEVSCETAVYWKALNSRRLTMATYDAVANTPVQTIYQIMNFRAGYEEKHGQQDHETIADVYNSNLQDVDSTLEVFVTKSTVANASKVYKAILSHHPLLQEVLLDEALRGKSGYLTLDVLQEISSGLSACASDTSEGVQVLSLLRLFKFRDCQGF